MNQCINWKSEDIETLRFYFLKGLSIKMIARTMARTPGAVNKALSRFHIRTPRCFKEKKAYLPSQTEKRSNSEKDPGMPSSWTSLFTILTWLREQNIIVHETSLDTFYIGSRPFSKMQIVMYANKLRLEQGHEIFLAKDVTW
ncbi:MAG: GcrA family cell cycle regulator [Alphaproteobacteria bacterium]|nr:GcrA family cell cycle regulator [Alphaproteobacteria bacterium]